MLDSVLPQSVPWTNEGGRWQLAHGGPVGDGVSMRDFDVEMWGNLI